MHDGERSISSNFRVGALHNLMLFKRRININFIDKIRYIYFFYLLPHILKVDIYIYIYMSISNVKRVFLFFLRTFKSLK
jgi:hypothetical protein